MILPRRTNDEYVFSVDQFNKPRQLNTYEKWLVESRVWLQNLSSNPAVWFGLEYADTVVERVPLILGSQNIKSIQRTKLK